MMSDERLDEKWVGESEEKEREEGEKERKQKVVN